MNVANLELCKELYELSGWEFDEQHCRIEKVWIESFSTSEMGQGHDDYDKTPPEERKQYHVGDFVVRDNPKNFVGVPENVPWGWANKYYEETIKRSVPAYDLGYLLRKLPAKIDTGESVELHEIYGWLYMSMAEDGKEWHFGYGVVDLHGQADTPEDAACKLAIELFKQGVLSPNPSKETL